MDQILTALRTLLIDYIATSEALTANASLGATSVTVGNTSRFRVDDEIFIMSNDAGFAESSKIDSILDYQTLHLSSPTLRAWTTTESAMIQKAVNYQPLGAVYLGDLPSIPKFPAITISPMSEDNEWLTLRSTTHDYKFQIRAYVLADNSETTNLYLPRLAKQIREVLIDHVHPIIDSDSFLLTADLPAGATVVSIASTSAFAAPSLTFIRDNNPRPSSEENRIATVLSATNLELGAQTKYDYLVARGAEIFHIKRFMYDTRPNSIQMGFSPQKGGALLKVASIDYFAKEWICREGTVIV